MFVVFVDAVIVTVCRCGILRLCTFLREEKEQKKCCQTAETTSCLHVGAQLSSILCCVTGFTHTTQRNSTDRRRQANTYQRVRCVFVGEATINFTNTDFFPQVVIKHTSLDFSLSLFPQLNLKQQCLSISTNHLRFCRTCKAAVHVMEVLVVLLRLLSGP